LRGVRGEASAASQCKQNLKMADRGILMKYEHYFYDNLISPF